MSLRYDNDHPLPYRTRTIGQTVCFSIMDALREETPMLLRISFAFFALFVAPFASAQDRYYGVFFAANSSRPAAAHTWATFIRLKGEVIAAAAETRAPSVETVTISWLPATGVVAPHLLGSGEPGRNFGLKETLEWAKKTGAPVTAWGPVEIKKDLYDLALRKKKTLESGSISYRVLDRRGRGGDWTNCIHAISDIVPGPMLATGTAFGENATLLVANHLRPFFVGRDVNHDSVRRYLGIDGFDIRYESLDRMGRKE